MNAKKISILIISGFLVLLFSNAIWAKDPLQNRQYKQKNRIKQGLESGEITKQEFLRLKRGQKQIQQYTRRAQKDGRISRHERLTIARMQERNDERIYNAKHNRRHRYNEPRRYDNKHKYHYRGSNRCYRSHRDQHRGYSSYTDGAYFSGTWFDPHGFFSFSTGSKW